jgi:hypothetical protein
MVAVGQEIILPVAVMLMRLIGSLQQPITITTEQFI